MTEEKTWSIAEVERETGLGKDTLRVWERRYGFPQPLRDALGERVYPDDQVQRLRLIKRLLDAGHRPGKVVPLDLPQVLALAQGVAQALTPTSGPALAAGAASPLPSIVSTSASASASEPRAAPDDAAALASAPASPLLPPGAVLADGVLLHEAAQWLQWVAQNQTDTLRQKMQQFIVRHGLGRAVDALVAPLCALVGQAWLRGEVSVYQEHLFSETLQSVLREAIAAADASASDPPTGPRVLLTTTPQEQHGLGLLMAECHLALESCVRFVLGVNTPVADIVLAAQQLRIDVLALSFSAYSTRRELADSLQQLRAQLPAQVEIWVGGAAASRHSRALPKGTVLMRKPADVVPQVQAWRVRQQA